MLIQLLGLEYFFGAVTTASLAFGRALKRWFPGMPARALPFAVVIFGYAVVLVDQLAGGAHLDRALTFAGWGLLSGGVAVGGHELLKALIESVLALFMRPEVARAWTIAILGRLRKLTEPRIAPPPRPRMNAGGALLVLCALAAPAASCTARQLETLRNVLDVASQGSQLLGSTIDAAESGAAIYLARHPSVERAQEVNDALHRARVSKRAYDALLATGEAIAAEDLEAARASALDAYGHLYALLGELGILDASPPAGGAENESATPPEPLELPSRTELADAMVL